MSTPKYNIGDIVYLAESAKLGFLESYQVASMRLPVIGQWLYTIQIPARQGVQGLTMGDQIRINKSVAFELIESSLIPFRGALDLALESAESRVAYLRSVKSSKFPQG